MLLLLVPIGFTAWLGNELHNATPADLGQVQLLALGLSLIVYFGLVLVFASYLSCCRQPARTLLMRERTNDGELTVDGEQSNDDLFLDLHKEQQRFGAGPAPGGGGRPSSEVL